MSVRVFSMSEISLASLAVDWMKSLNYSRSFAYPRDAGISSLVTTSLRSSARSLMTAGLKEGLSLSDTGVCPTGIITLDSFGRKTGFVDKMCQIQLTKFDVDGFF